MNLEGLPKAYIDIYTAKARVVNDNGELVPHSGGMPMNVGVISGATEAMWGSSVTFPTFRETFQKANGVWLEVWREWYVVHPSHPLRKLRQRYIEWQDRDLPAGLIARELKAAGALV